MDFIFFVPLIIFIVMASLMLGCFCYQKKRYENMQYVIYRVNPSQADTSSLPVIQGATDMYVIGLHRPGQPNLQMCNVNSPVVAGFMSNLHSGGLPGTSPYTPMPNYAGTAMPPPKYV